MNVNVNDPKDSLSLSEATKKLWKLLLIYAIGITLCRLMGTNMASMRFISWADWLMFRKDVIAQSAFGLIRKFPLQRLPYVLMPFVGLFWLSGKQSRAGLFFVVGMNWMGIVNHTASLLVYLYLYYKAFLRGRFVFPGLWVIIALALAAGFSFLSYRMFQIAKFLYVRKNAAENSQTRGIVGAFLVLVLCCVFPFVNYREMVRRAANLFSSVRNVTLLKSGSDIRFMDGSPDGRLLAVGANDGVSVWDAESRQCVWSDDSIVVQRVRFSPSGRYLAAAGRGVPEGTSDLAVFEVDGFRRLPGFDWPEEDLRKEKIFHDLVFRPDERSLLAAWHRDWDWDQMTREEVVALMTKEADEVAPGKPKVRVQSLSYTELGLEAGNISFSKEFGPLSLYYDLFEQGAIYFSPDASFLLYPKCYVQNNSVARHEAHYQVYRVDTRTWAEEEILLDRKYSIAIPVERAVWHEWKFTQDGKTAYLLATEGDERGGSDRAFVLLKMDMTTQQTEELRRVPKTRSSEWIPWNRIALSPDEKQIILLEYGEAYDNETEIRVVALRIWDMTTGKTKKIVCKHEGKAYSIARRIIWLSRKTLAISKGRGDGFFFVDI